MTKATFSKAGDKIYRLRQQINLEENRGKLRDLVFRLQAALNEEQQKMPTAGTTHARHEENPFDTVILG